MLDYYIYLCGWYILQGPVLLAEHFLFLLHLRRFHCLSCHGNPQ